MVTVWPPCQEYLDAFFALSAGRAFSGGMSAFPLGLRYSDISAYAKDHGHRPGPGLVRFVALVRACDQEYIGWWNRKYGAK